MFLKRNYEKEIMDDFSIADERIDEALKELKTINRLLGGNSVSREGLGKFITADKRLTILDVGSGDSGVLLQSKNDKNKFEIFSIDINKRCCLNAKENSSDIKIICADVFDLPFNKKIFDVIHISLFLHHFGEKQIEEILKKLSQLSIKGIVINDLRRSVLAFAGIKILTTLFSKSKMVKNDGPLSVRRGFLKEELVSILYSAGIKNFNIKRKWAFRWLVVIRT
jgi:ubiquinone/menaquinone biosynthesis C-methylase UbiE